MELPVINCGWCNRPVPQPDTDTKLYCNDTHKKRASEKRNGKGNFAADKKITCLGCGEKQIPSARLQGVMAICLDCHCMSYAMCWRKARMDRAPVMYKRKHSSVNNYNCPICLGWHWTRNDEHDDRIDLKREAQNRIGDYVRRMYFTADELKDLYPYGWGTRIAV